MAGKVVTAPAGAELRDRLLRVLGGVPATPAPAQLEMLGAAAAQDGMSKHVDLVAARVTGPVDVAALRAALDSVVARHEALRTHFLLEPRRLMVVRPPEPTRLDVEEIDDLAHAASRAATLLATPVDIRSTEPHRALLLTRDEHTHVLLAPLRHLLSDEVSHGVYLRDLAACYAGEPQAECGRYRDHAAAQTAALADGAAVHRRVATLAPPLPAMTWPRTPDKRRYRQHTATATWTSGWLGETTRRLAMRGFTFGILCAAAYAAALHAVTGAKDIRIGTSMANRDSEHTNTIGLFATMSVLRLLVSDDDPADELLHRARTTMLGAVEDAVPLAAVLGALRESTPGFRASGLYEATLTVVNQGRPVPAGAATAFEPVDGFDVDDRPAPAFVPTHLAVRRGTGGRDTEVRLGYNTDLLTADDAETMLATMAAFLQTAADHPERVLGAVRDG
jgi:nonribosomal peptide synthetase DhbF